MAQIMGKDMDYYTKYISFVKDRPGHDRRYAIDCERIKRELGWKSTVRFEEGIGRTIQWYIRNKMWVENIRSGDYRKWIEKNYSDRLPG